MHEPNGVIRCAKLRETGAFLNPKKAISAYAGTS